jgi:hypothetical protein
LVGQRGGQGVRFRSRSLATNDQAGRKLPR